MPIDDRKDVASAAAHRVAADLKKARLARGWSQGELARRSGTSQANISVLETGASDPRLGTVAVLAATLGLELLLVDANEVRLIRVRARDPAATPTSVLEEVRVLDPEPTDEDDEP